jgi:hypothetical protein
MFKRKLCPANKRRKPKNEKPWNQINRDAVADISKQIEVKSRSRAGNVI